MAVQIYLADCAESHAGYQRPSDLLNGPRPFFPARNPEGEVLFLQRDALVALSVEVEDEFGGGPARAEDLAPDEAVNLDLEVTLEDGGQIRGTIRSLMPAAHRRLQDILNLEARFLTLRDGDRVYLINKRRIVRVSSL